jgi:hypothetical protein
MLLASQSRVLQLNQWQSDGTSVRLDNNDARHDADCNNDDAFSDDCYGSSWMLHRPVERVHFRDTQECVRANGYIQAGRRLLHAEPVSGRQRL